MRIPFNLAEGIFFIAAAVGALVMALGYHTPENFRLSPALFPIAAALVLIGLALVLVFKSAKRNGVEQAGQPQTSSNALNVCLIFLLCLLYTAVMDKVGFILATFIYLLAFLLLLGERRVLVVVLVPVLTSGVVWLFFGKALSVPLP